MKKMTKIAAAVALATVSASASSWWGNPWSDQTQMLDAQREYTEKLAAQQAQVRAAQREYAEQLVAEQARVAEQIAAQQAEAQAAQRKYAEQFAAAQARIAKHMAAQQAEAQAAQREYAKLLAAQQAQVVEAQRSYLQRVVANQPVSAPASDGEAVAAMLPPGSSVDPLRMDSLAWASPLDSFVYPLSPVLKERLKESEARRAESRKAMDTRRTEMESWREAALKKLQERRQARPHYVGLRKPLDRPTREEI